MSVPAPLFPMPFNNVNYRTLLPSPSSAIGIIQSSIILLICLPAIHSSGQRRRSDGQQQTSRAGSAAGMLKMYSEETTGIKV